ncbi:hypothetical protein EHJ37_19630 [Vibrio parahaemolyticus]|nr:hypothetical protein [Vibrio parahaemolyticus]
MGLQRIKKAKEGVELYLINGTQSIGIHRDEYDNRVPLWGDINSLLDASNLIKEKKDWESSYRHFTFSFSPEDHLTLMKMDPLERKTKLASMVEDMLRKFYPHRDPLDLISYAEAHEPNPESKAYLKATRKLESRPLHIHLVTSNWDAVTSNKLEQVSSHIDVLNAIQSDICADHGLQDPAYFVDYDRVESHWKYKKVKQEGGSDPKLVKREFSIRDQIALTLINNSVESPADIKKALLASGLVDSVRVTFSKRNGIKVVANITESKRQNDEKVVNMINTNFTELLSPIYDKYYDAFLNGDRDFLKDSFFDITDKVDIYTPEKKAELIKSYNDKLAKTHIFSSTKEGRFRIAGDKSLRETIIDKATKKFLAKESVVYDAEIDTYKRNKNLSNQKYFDDFVEQRESYRQPSSFSQVLEESISDKFKPWKAVAYEFDLGPEQQVPDESFSYRETFRKRNEFGQTFEELTRAQRNFFAVYKKNIHQSIIQDTVVFTDRYNPENHVIHNKQLGVSIIDHTNEECLSVRGYQDSQDKDAAIRIMLETAVAKGWPLEDIEVSGTEEFKSSIERIRAEMMKDETPKMADDDDLDLIVVSSTSGEQLPMKGKPIAVTSQISAIENAAREQINKRNKRNISNNHVLAEAKASFDEDRVKRLIVSTKLNINVQSLTFGKNKKGHITIKETESDKALNIVDFLLKKHGMSLNKIVQLSREELLKSKLVSPDDLEQILTPPFSKKDMSHKEMYISGLNKLYDELQPVHRHKKIIDHILMDTSRTLVLEPIIQSGIVDGTSKDVQDKIDRLFDSKYEFINMYQRFASIAANVEDDYNALKMCIESSVESKLEGENKTAAYEFLEDIFTDLYLNQLNLKNSLSLSDSDAQIELLVSLQHIPNFDEVIDEANEKIKTGYTRKKEPINAAQSELSTLSDDNLDTTEEYKVEPKESKSKLETEREKMFRLGPLYMPPQITLKPRGY